MDEPSPHPIGRRVVTTTAPDRGWVEPGRPEPVRVTVVVVTYNSAPVLPGFLEALGPALEGVGRWQLVVADNASADGTPDLIRELAPDATVLASGTNDGYAAGINAAAAVADPASALLILNPDTRPGPGSVAPLIAAVEQDGIGIAVPRLLEDDGRLSWSLRHEPTVGRTLAEAVLGGRAAARLGVGEVMAGRADYAQGHERAAWATGAALLVSSACRHAIGRWDESFFLYSEETDFALRARDAGWRLRYVPESTMVHIGGESRVSPRLWSLLVVNKVRLHRQRHGRTRGLAFHAALLAGQSLRAARGSATHRAALRALLRAPDPSPVPVDAPREVA